MQNHGIFQGHNLCHHIGLDRNLRDSFRSSPPYERTTEFVARYDNRAVDPDAETLPLASMLRRLMAKSKQSVYKRALDAACLAVAGGACQRAFKRACHATPPM